jgi:hypothetical protein
MQLIEYFGATPGDRRYPDSTELFETEEEKQDLASIVVIS